jgi:SAM-dependent methyltransferase
LRYEERSRAHPSGEPPGSPEPPPLVRFADKARCALSEPEQYARQAEAWSERAYADSAAYLAHRADLVVGLGPRLQPGDTVLDLACGDAGLGELLVERGFRYRGVDSTPEMVEAARARLGDRAPVELGDLNDYAPPEPVAATTVFRAIYYAHDRAAFFRHVAGFTERKLVFDLNPRQYRLEDVRADLRAAGLGNVSLRPFFVPQTVVLPRPLGAIARVLERSGPLARCALRYRFTYFVAASR